MGSIFEQIQEHLLYLCFRTEYRRQVILKILYEFYMPKVKLLL